MKTNHILLLLLFALLSCKKQDQWLDKKSNKSDITPTKLADFQMIMNNTGVMNEFYSGAGGISSDNFYITYANWLSAFSNSERNMYVWAKDIYEGGSSSDWNNAYQRIGFSNIVLDGIAKISVTDQNRIEWNTLKGTALYFRGLNFFELVQTFGKPYDKNNANSDLGIVLRLTSDVNEKSTRATLQNSYDQLISDLTASESLLPTFPQFKTQPSKISAQGTLARVYLCMGNYERARHYANLALSSYSSLIDYNTLNASAQAPFPTFQTDNKEIIFYATTALYGTMTYSKLRVDDNLYASYTTGDLRKQIFYVSTATNGIAFKGQYTGNINGAHFDGVATNELFLIRAESAARLEDLEQALSDLSSLLKSRWDKNIPYVPFVTTDKEMALRKILEERRKEIPFLGARRWEDLRRLNLDIRFAKTLTRTLNGTVYSLPPNDPRYVYALPDIEIRLSGLPQNIR